MLTRRNLFINKYRVINLKLIQNKHKVRGNVMYPRRPTGAARNSFESRLQLFIRKMFNKMVIGI